MLVGSFEVFSSVGSVLTQQCEGLSGLLKVFGIVHSLDEDVLP